MHGSPNAKEIDTRILVRSLAHARGRRRIGDDLGTLGLVLLGLISSLLEKGVLTRDDLVAHLREIDRSGRVTPDHVRAALGLEPEPRRPKKRAR